MKDSQKTEADKELEHQKKMNGYLSMFNFLLAFLVGYYYGFHYAASLTAIVSVVIGYKVENTTTLFKQVWKLASPYVFMIGIGFINPAVIPLGLAGVLFTALGIHLQTLNQSNITKLTIVIAALVLAIYGSLIEYPKYVQNVLGEERNEFVQNFKVVDLEGNTVQLTDFKNRVVLLDFWATWCKPCRDEFKELENVVQHFSGNPEVVVLIINAKGSKDDLNKIIDFQNQNKYDLPFYKDLSGYASSYLKVSAYPTLGLIDKSGNLRFYHTGYSNTENLESFLIQKIETLLSE